MKKKVLIDLLVGVASLGIIVGVTVPTLVNSYNDWLKYYEENKPEIDPATYSDLIAVEAKLNDGIQYFNNLKANPIKEHFTVTATYKYADNAPEHPGETFEYVLDPLHYDWKLTVPADFHKNGGTLVITYKEFEKQIPYTLINVELQELVMLSTPYNVTYEKDTTFNPEGLVLEGHNNDGSTEAVNVSDCTFSVTGPLTKDITKVVCSYTKGEKTITLDIPIKVVDVLNNGAVKSIGRDYRIGVVRDGQPLSTASLYVLGTYESGNKKLLDESEVSFENGNEIAQLGKKAVANLTLASNSKIKTDVDLYVSKYIEAETATQVGGKIVAEEEWVVENGQLVEKSVTTSVGDFGKTVQNGGEASIKFDVTSASKTKADVTLRCANSNLVRDANELFWMNPLTINTIADLYVNGQKVTIESDVILSGCGPAEEYAPLYNVYSLFTFKNIDLNAGANTIKLQFKRSTINELNHWKESPSTMNVDYLEVKALGEKIETSTKNVTSIFFDEGLTIKYGDNLDTLQVAVFGVVDDNKDNVVFLDPSTYTLTKPSGLAQMGEITLSASLNSKPEITCTKTFTIKGFRLEAELAKIAGSKKVVAKTETAYEGDDGSYAEIGSVTYIGGMDNSATKHSGETSLTFTFNAIAATNSLTIRCTNSNIQKDPERATATKVDDCFDIYVNGTLFATETIIPANNSSNQEAVWNGFFTLNLGNITLKDGENTIKFVANKNAPKHYWNEAGIPRMDWIEINAANK